MDKESDQAYVWHIMDMEEAQEQRADALHLSLGVLNKIPNHQHLYDIPNLEV